MNRYCLYECGICEGWHPWEWDGDCRENANRYENPEDYADRNGITEEIELHSWEERIAEDV